MENIRELRESAGLTQTELARRTGIAQPNISAYEIGMRTVTNEVLTKVREATRPRPSDLVARHRSQIIEIVQSHKGTAVKVFGSAARNTDTVDSDLDLLVDLQSSADLVDLIAIRQDVEELLGISVDVVSSGGLKQPARSRIEKEAKAL